MASRNSGGGFIKLKRGEFTDWLLKNNPNAFLLLVLIASRARYTVGVSLDGLTLGQACIGDYASCGLTEKKYRTAKKHLASYGLVRFKPNTLGTVATLLDARVFELYDLRDDANKGGRRGGLLSEEELCEGADSVANEGRTEGEQRATNQKESRKEKKESSSYPDSSESDEKGDVENSTNPEAEKFVDWFLNLLADTGAPIPRLTKSNRENWAGCYDKMICIDGRTRDEVNHVCRWARNDSFWRKNFMSPMKLREKKDGVMWFDAFMNKAGGYTTVVEKLKFTRVEPIGWQAFVDEEFPTCAYAKGQEKHGCKWSEVEDDHQKLISEAMEKAARKVS